MGVSFREVGGAHIGMRLVSLVIVGCASTVVALVGCGRLGRLCNVVVYVRSAKMVLRVCGVRVVVVRFSAWGLCV